MAEQEMAPPVGNAAGMYDAKGRFVPAKLIKPLDRQRHELVLEMVGKARALSELMAAFKAGARDDITAFRCLAAEQYGARSGGAKGNVTLTSYDGRYKITLQVQDRMVFDERLQVAKELIDACLSEWAEGASDKIRALVMHAFQVDKAGQISTERVLSLRSFNIPDDANWERAMQAIQDSMSVQSSTTYLRFYERVGDEGDKYTAISLDLAAL